VRGQILFLLSEESVSVPAERMDRLVLKLRPVPGALKARATIERALSTQASAVSLDRTEKMALLDGLNGWLLDGRFEPLGTELIDLRGALEYDLGVGNDVRR
jgi:hypothetical protein